METGIIEKMVNHIPNRSGALSGDAHNGEHANRFSLLLRHLRGLVLVTHPLPSALYVVATAILAWLAAATVHTRPGAGPLALVLVVVAAAQIAIGSTNDFCDREVDAAGDRREKPLVSGLIHSWEAVALAAVASAVVILAVLPLGLVVCILGLLILGLGLAYDLRFKGTPLSAVLFALYFPLFPLLAWTVFGRWQPFLLWLVPFGAALGIAMNISNTLPDLQTDLAAGMRGLPHLLGLKWGAALAWTTPLVVLVCMWLLDLARLVPAEGAGLIIASAGGLVAGLLPPALYLRHPAPETLRLAFIFQGVGIVTLAGGWIAAVAF